MFRHGSARRVAWTERGCRGGVLRHSRCVLERSDEAEPQLPAVVSNADDARRTAPARRGKPPFAVPSYLLVPSAVSVAHLSPGPGRSHAGGMTWRDAHSRSRRASAAPRHRGAGSRTQHQRRQPLHGQQPPLRCPGRGRCPRRGPRERLGDRRQRRRRPGGSATTARAARRCTTATRTSSPGSS